MIEPATPSAANVNSTGLKNGLELKMLQKKATANETLSRLKRLTSSLQVCYIEVKYSLPTLTNHNTCGRSACACSTETVSYQAVIYF